MKKLISLLLVVVLCLSFAVTAFAEEFVQSPSETPDDCDHPETEIVNKKDPTCTTPGSTAVYTCANGCGKTEGGAPIDSLGHNEVIDPAVAPGCVAEGKTGNECLPLNYNNNGFVYSFSENAELLPEDVKAAAQAAWDKLVATANTLDYKSIELK